MKIADTPEPPYYAAIFTSIRTEDDEGYAEMNILTEQEAEKYDGYLGNEYFRNPDGFGIHISYWRDMEVMNKWKKDSLHQKAKRMGKERWYESYKLRVCKIEYDSGSY